jgi:hypothetical protein
VQAACCSTRRTRTESVATTCRAPLPPLAQALLRSACERGIVVATSVTGALDGDSMRHHHWHHHWMGDRHERRRQRAAFGLASAASIVAAVLASGCHDSRRDERGRRDDRTEARVERALDWLDLEGEARERARTVGMRLAAEADGVRRDGTQLASEILAQWRSDTPDAATLRAAVDREVDGLRARAHRALDDVLELHAILDPEQRADVDELLAWREGGRRHRHRW